MTSCFRPLLAGCGLLLALLPGRLLAQATCMLVPVPLAERTRQATLVVEAQVQRQQAEPAGSNIVTRHTLTVYKVLKGTLPAGPLSLRTAGGTLGLRCQVATSTLDLAVGTQGIFLLEADPLAPGEWRACAGPQGLLRYDLTDGSASDPFARYPRLGADARQAVAALAGAPWREVQPNPALTATSPATSPAASPAASPTPARPAAGQRLAATASITGFAPAAVVAGAKTSTSTSLLTISGTGFNAGRGTGYVEFRNADNPGSSGAPNYVQPLASDYVLWNDTQIQVRVPARSSPTTNGSPAGTGLVRVTNSDASTATSATALTVTYALSNVAYDPGTGLQTYRIHLVGDNGAGGYTLTYAASLPAAARPPFATAGQSWQCATAMNRPIDPGPAAIDQVSGADGVNIVRFAAANELALGVLGVTQSSYSGCSSGGAINWYLTDTDYSFAPVPFTGYTWNYSAAASTTTNAQFDFQSVALHELGHGEQLTHLIAPPGVMNYAIGNGQEKRVLDASTDVAGGTDVLGFSTSATALERCNQPAFVATPGGCPAPLPVALTAFSARYQPGRGTALAWATATEQQSAAFVVESQDEAPGASGGALWLAVLRQAAAGSSLTPRQYAALDPRPLAGLRYYRLRLEDHDGTLAYSPVVTVSAPEDAFSVYPNPAHGTVRLSGPRQPGTAAQVRLFDATGRCLARASAPADAPTAALPLAGVPAGLYLVEWDGGAGTRRTRLVVE